MNFLHESNSSSDLGVLGQGRRLHSLMRLLEVSVFDFSFLRCFACIHRLATLSIVSVS